ncbi:substrate-binding domain-containing protein [Agromyces salentinus]|uniref:substrate-binding domain-containing protein n=1 Tax=Agromyces salentinus TaxID=269421 RepID=UPI001478EE31|nr:substrate-binding domain-containing protein [Agromyces salentinus]
MIVAAATASLALVGIAGTAWAGGSLSAWLASAPACIEPVELTVVADTAIARPVKELAAEYDAREDACARTEVVAQDSADTSALLASGNGSDVDAWIPDSPVWLVRTAASARSLGRDVPDVALERSIASSPVVFAAPVSGADALAGRTLDWNAVLTGELPTLLADPEASSASLNGLQAMERATPIGQAREFTNAMIRLSDGAPTRVDAAFSSLAVSPPGTVAIASEQQVAMHNHDDAATPLLALYPADGTLALQFPFLRMLDESELAKNQPADGEAAKDEESERLAQRAAQLNALKIALWDASDRFAAEGFRDGTGGGELEQDGVIADATEVGSAAASAQVAILRNWGVLSLRSRILSVIDVSGSMEEPTVTGLRRIDLVTQAASSTVSQLSEAVDVGLWAFSTARIGDQDWEPLSGIEPLAEDEHRTEVLDVIGSLPGRLGGATGLYDTTLAAVQAVREHYDPENVNSVLLLTDGRNEDENGISRETLLDELAAITGSDRPVPVVLVGVGPDTDLESMRLIAEATGGAAYSAQRPEDLKTVLTDALSQRSCRPNC